MPLLKVSNAFKKQLDELSVETERIEDDKKLTERIYKAIAYFLDFTIKKIKNPFETFNFTTDNKQVKKDLNRQLDQLEDLLSIKLFCLRGLTEKFSTANYLGLRAKAVLQKLEKPSRSLSKKREAITSTKHPELFEELRELRHTIAHSENLSHFQIFTQKSLYEMCEYLPATAKQLRTINGMGKVRVEKYGEEILEIIQKHARAKGLTPTEVRYEETEEKTQKVKKTDTKQVSLDLFQSGKTIEEIAKERGLVKTTIESHLVHFISTGEVKITDLMPEKKYKELKKVIKKIPFDSFSELKEKIDNKFTYSEIRLVTKELNKES
jgi:hypothetical protein